MSILAFAGAEDGLAEGSISGAVDQSSTVARTGTYSFRMSHSLGDRTNSVVLSHAGRGTVFLQGAIRLANLTSGTDSPIITWRNGGVILGCITADTWQTGMKVWRGDKATQLGSIGVGIPTVSWLLLEVKIKIHDTEGEIKVWANGQSVFDYAGDTKPGTETTIDNIMYSQVKNNVNYYTYWDDLIVADDQGSYFNTGTQGAKIHRVAITGPGNYAQWTPQGDAANWNCIKETPPAIDKYVESTTTGQKDSYEPANSPVVGGIAAVAVRYWAQGGITLKRLCRSGGTDYLGSQLTMTGAFGKTDDIMYEHPAGGAWSESSFNAIEVGQEKV